MELKKATLNKCVFNREWNGPKGLIYYFNLEWSNGDSGQMSTNRIKNKDGEISQMKFAIGVEQEYTAEMRTSKKGDNYLFFDKPKQPYTPGTHSAGARKESPSNQQDIVRNTCFKAAVKYKAISGTETDVEALMTLFQYWVNKLGEGERNKSINAQAILNTMIELMGSHEQYRVPLSDLKIFFKQANHFMNIIKKDYNEQLLGKLKEEAGI